MTSQSVRIRMYCQGLGDCFLLTFPRTGDTSTEFHVLIDCGVIAGTENAREKMNAVAEDIFTATGGHLDLLVATHEHWDHVSGFNQARAVFDRFTIDHIWMGWTEDPKDPYGLLKNRQAKLNALNKAVDQMGQAALNNPGVAVQHKAIRQILSFFGEEGAGGLGVKGSTASTGTTRGAMEYLSTRADASVTYCYPSRPPFTLDGVDGVRVYVFGPPEDPAYLKMSNPNKTAKTYGLAAGDGEDSFLAALSSSQEGTRYGRIKDLTYPFEDALRIPAENAAASDWGDFFQANYGFDEHDPSAWRRIDADWLDVASELALNLDSDTNNTSLVLAFELGEPGSGKVLLFAADAQVGNWYSWKDLSWKVGPAGSLMRAQTAHDLLARTVLYKVGHHGSHNATLSALGLDLMVDGDLVALLPVDQEKAHDKGWDEMPFKPLLDHLGDKTSGRIVRIDDPGPPARQNPSRLSNPQWKRFLSTLRVQKKKVDPLGEIKLYVDYTLNY
jgi:hypothetical protein